MTSMRIGTQEEEGHTVDKKYSLEELLEKFQKDAVLVENDGFPNKDDFNLPLAFATMLENIIQLKKEIKDG